MNARKTHGNTSVRFVVTDKNRKEGEMLFFIIVIALIAAILAAATFSRFEIRNEQYDRLKWIVVRWSYLVVFISLIVKTFDIEYGVETVTIVSGIGALLAGLMGISAQNYYVNGEQSKFNADALEEMTEDAYEEQNDIAEEQ